MFVYCNVAYANLYKDASFKSAVDSQALLWEKLELLEKGEQFSRVVCEDGYKGWLSNHQISENSPGRHPLKMITLNQCPIYAEPDDTGLVIREAVAGSYITLIEQNPEFSKTILPDRTEGWISTESFKEITGNRRQNILNLSQRFLGVPYFWGGKSAKGMDCSGYVQLLHKLVGIRIRRDSPMQFDDAKFVSDNPLDGQPGDLLFFAENGDRITHVGLKLEKQKIIHARGMVRINSLVQDDADFDPTLIKHFVAVKSFL